MIYAVADKISKEILTARNPKSIYLRSKTSQRLLTKYVVRVVVRGNMATNNGYGPTIYEIYEINGQVAMKEYRTSKGTLRDWSGMPNVLK